MSRVASSARRGARIQRWLRRSSTQLSAVLRVFRNYRNRLPSKARSRVARARGVSQKQYGNAAMAGIVLNPDGATEFKACFSHGQNLLHSVRARSLDRSE